MIAALKREGEDMKQLVLSLLACLAVGKGDSHAAEPSKIELRLLKSVTVTEEQFLLGDASMKRFQRMYAPVDAQFAVYLSLYPPCSKTYIDDTDVVDRPIRLFNGTADEIAPIRQCLSYVKRLQDAGKDAQLTEYAGAFHGFDNPGTALSA